MTTSESFGVVCFLFLPAGSPYLRGREPHPEGLLHLGRSRGKTLHFEFVQTLSENPTHRPQVLQRGGRYALLRRSPKSARLRASACRIFSLSEPTFPEFSTNHARGHHPQQPKPQTANKTS